MKYISRIVTAGIIFSLVSAIPGKAQDQEISARIDVFRGEVRILKNKIHPIRPSIGMEITRDNWIRTGAGSWIRLRLEDGTVITVEENSFVSLTQAAAARQAWKGRSILNKIFGHRDNVQNPIAVTGVRGDRLAPEITRDIGYDWAEEETECNNLLRAAFSSYSNQRYNLGILSSERYLKQCRTDPGKNDIIILMGFIYHETAQFEKSNEYLAQLDNKAGERARETALFLTALNYNYAELYSETVKHFESYIEKYPRGRYTAEAVYMTGLTYEMMDRPDKAKTYYQIVIDDFPDAGGTADACREKLAPADTGK